MHHAPGQRGRRMGIGAIVGCAAAALAVAVAHEAPQTVPKPSANEAVDAPEDAGSAAPPVSTDAGLEHRELAPADSGAPSEPDSTVPLVRGDPSLLPLAPTRLGKLGRFFALGAGAAVAQRERTLLVYEPGDAGAPLTRTLTAPADLELVGSYESLLLVEGPGVIVGLDSRDGKEVFRTALGAASVRVREVAAARGVVLARVPRPDGFWLMGIDATSGAVRFRAPIPSGVDAMRVAGGRYLVAGETFDVESGEHLPWLPGRPFVNELAAADFSHFYMVGTSGADERDRLDVYTATTGFVERSARLRRSPRTPFALAPSPDGSSDTLYYAADDGVVAAALDEPDAGERWGERWTALHPNVATRSGIVDEPSVRVLDDFLVACTPNDGTLRVLHRASGKERFRWGAGDCAPIVAILANDALSIFTTIAGEGVVFSPGPPALEPFEVRGRVTFEGAPRRNARVRVGDALTRTDATGEFRVRGVGGGTLRVQAEAADVPADDKCERGARANIAAALRGRGSYEVTLALEQVCTCGH